jgi:hypothetical protein
MLTHRQPKPQMVVIPAFTTQVLATNSIPAKVAELEHSTIATKKKKRKRK